MKAFDRFEDHCGDELLAVPAEQYRALVKVLVELQEFLRPTCGERRPSQRMSDLRLLNAAVVNLVKQYPNLAVGRFNELVEVEF